MARIASPAGTRRLQRQTITEAGRSAGSRANRIPLRCRRPAPSSAAASTPVCRRCPPTCPSCLIDRPGFRLWHLHEHLFSVPRQPLHLHRQRTCGQEPASHRHGASGRGTAHGPPQPSPTRRSSRALATRFMPIRGFTINLSGFADKQPLLLDMILGNRTLGYPDPARFSEIKEQLIRNWENQSKTRPSPSCSTSSPVCCNPTTRPSSSCCATCAPSNSGDAGFVSQLFARVHLEPLVHGDWTAAEALELAACWSATSVPTASPAPRPAAPHLHPGQGTLIREQGAITRTRRCWSTTSPAPPGRGISPASPWPTTSCPPPSFTSCAPASSWGMWWAPATCLSIAIRG